MVTSHQIIGFFVPYTIDNKENNIVMREQVQNIE